MIFDLASDFAAALEALPQGHPRRRVLELVEEAIRLGAHFIARHFTTLLRRPWNGCGEARLPFVPVEAKAAAPIMHIAAGGRNQRGRKSGAGHVTVLTTTDALHWRVAGGLLPVFESANPIVDWVWYAQPHFFFARRTDSESQ